MPFLTFVPNTSFAPRRNALKQLSCPCSWTLQDVGGHPVHKEVAHPIVQRGTIHMKKGRSRQPMQPRRQEQMALPEDGTPVFAIFVRTPRARLWYPLGAVKGDDRSKGLVDAMKGKFARGIYENALDRGIAQTIYGKDSNRFLQNALRMYPQLKKSTKDLEFGYRVAAVGLDDQPTKVVAKDMALPFMAWARKRLDSALKGMSQKD